jgi:hypothetical protein
MTVMTRKKAAKGASNASLSVGIISPPTVPLGRNRVNWVERIIPPPDPITVIRIRLSIPAGVEFVKVIVRTLEKGGIPPEG